MPKRQETSAIAYRQLVDSGQLVGKQRLILDALIRIGSSTSGEILDALARADGGPGPISNINAWRGRFTELQGRGLIREVAQRRCKVSGRLCVVWAPTGRTKPLDRKRGARAAVPESAWKELAERLAEALRAVVDHDGEMETDGIKGALADYRKLAGGAR